MVPSDQASAIVLAGGRSHRFGGEKLAAELDGEPLLHHSIRSAALVCDEVLVVGAPSGLPVALPGAMARVLVEVRDIEPHAGPLMALAHAAPLASHPRIVLIAGDMPRLLPAILRRVLLWGEGSEGACLVVDDWPQPFPMGLDRTAAVTQSAALLATGERSLRGLIEHLNIDQVPEEEWRQIDPDGRSLRDVDRPEDLGA